MNQNLNVHFAVDNQSRTASNSNPFSYLTMQLKSLDFLLSKIQSTGQLNFWPRFKLACLGFRSRPYLVAT